LRRKYPEPWKRSGSPFYQWWYTNDAGKRQRISTGEALKERAREEIRKYVDSRGAETGKSDLSFRAYAEPFFSWDTCPRIARLLDEGKSIGKTHVTRSRRWLEKYVFTDAIFLSLLLRNIKRADILDLRNRLRAMKNGGQINTVNKVIATVKTILSEATFRQDIDSNPGADVGNVKYKQLERGTFTVEETREVLSKRPGDMSTNPLVDAVVTVLLCTGCRAGEIRALRWAAVDLRSGKTAIREAFKSEKEIGDPKWGKKRDIVLPRILIERLEKWKKAQKHNAPGDFVFSTIDGHSLGQTWIRKNLIRVLRSAHADEEIDFEIGERWLTPHACRHTLNSHLLAAGVPPLLVQTFLGWSSEESRVLTRVQRSYTELKLFRIEDVASKIDELYGERKEKARERA
jgi:integrase